MILTRKQTADYLSQNNNFVILTHRRPDGDTLGSSAMLCRGLRQLGKNAHILRNPEMTGKYAFLHEGLTKDTLESGEILIAVDTASAGMLPERQRDLRQTESIAVSAKINQSVT